MASNARARLHATKAEPERVIVVGVDTGDDRTLFDVELDELVALARAADTHVVARVVQRRSKIDPSTLVGAGKADELAALVRERHAAGIVVLNTLRPRQRAALEKLIGGDAFVIDRNVVILDIFARHARTAEGKLQVELAQLRHRAANLIGTRDSLSRLGGGIGTRGPGETKLEVDRRRIRLRISHLEAQLDDVRKRRREQRRTREGTPVVALVGYTNAGKSSLLNALTGAQAFVADQPFATLDPTLRKLHLGGTEAIAADTVGFITDLPKEPVAAFAATLEEVTDATALLHVIDVSNPYWRRQRDAVETLLAQLGAGDKPAVIAWNKTDLTPQPMGNGRGERPHDEGVAVSAKTGDGLTQLRAALERSLHRKESEVHA
ncbi:MAG: GTPase HflX [Candidatus Eremiobacteraeota bacterium]|nr:GTPase HflX [Candidatus Eremiobacteraeota bacterium]